MHAEFWHQRWAENQIGFHQEAPNAALTEHLQWLLSTGHRVLVPLAGKTHDITVLRAAGAHVVASELSELAVRQYFAHEGLPYTEIKSGEHICFRAEGLEFWCGDFMKLPQEVEPVDAVYDRAALIALPPNMRADYVEKLRALSKPRGHALVLTLAYPEGTGGPPFSIPRAQLLEEYEGFELIDAHTEEADPQDRLRVRFGQLELITARFARQSASG